MHRRSLLLAPAALAASPVAMPAIARAQAPWPNRPVRIINPYAPGGTSDLIVRPLAERLERAFGRPFLVDNRPGAGGSLGTGEAARAAADGHTLLISNTGPLSVAPALFPNLAYDPARAFSWIAMFGGAPLVCAVKGDGPLRTVAVFRALAARRAEEVSFGSSGVGSAGHLAGVLWSLQAGVQLLHVPFRGAAAAQQAVLSGDTTSLWDTSGANAGMIRGGQLRGLAVSSAERVAALPDVPSVRELGFAEAVATNWFVLAAPAGLDPAIAARLAAEIHAALAEPATRERLEGIGVVSLGTLDPAAIAAFVAGEIARWAPVVRAGNIQPG